ncbi:hypothetical protein AVEN_80455-1 [Araneus ventricosus]|uniref:Tc1-like transposase DDE domain-containing protein n=1 Tax=Araneus ventricosus TaxID=182803 RepID=A0A4Y2HAQ2_ARAVE|nr:hypothetical protein AVEN_80455-1 [Araneus ventricosus]
MLLSCHISLVVGKSDIQKFLRAIWGDQAYAPDLEDKLGDFGGKMKVLDDEATFHVCGHVHRHNVRVWAAENPRAYVEYERNTPKVNVWCALMHDKVIGPFFFAELTVRSNIYLDMLQLYAVPQFPEGVILQRDGAPPHYDNIVREFLDTTFPQRWMARVLSWYGYDPRT